VAELGSLAEDLIPVAKPLKKRLLKLARFAETQNDEGGGCLAGILTLFVFMALSNGMFALMEYLVVRCSYGSAAWAAGLRIINNKGDLSNGDVLTGWAFVAPYLGTFFLSAPIALSAYLSFRYVGYRLRGRKWN
jgi:hypothetical protein